MISSARSSENLPPHAVARLARELKDLFKNPPAGYRIIPGNNLGELVAELEGPSGTPYESYFYKIKLVVAGDFPATPPRGFFLTKIYHPNIDATTGAICVNTLKRDWTADTTLRHVFTVIRCLLIVPFPESSLNDEAGKLFMDSYAEYAKRAKLMADVHGRPAPSSDVGDADGTTAKSPSTASTVVLDDRVLKNASDNPLRTNNTHVKAKKKSLKRL